MGITPLIIVPLMLFGGYYLNSGSVMKFVQKYTLFTSAGIHGTYTVDICALVRWRLAVVEMQALFFRPIDQRRHYKALLMPNSIPLSS